MRILFLIGLLIPALASAQDVEVKVEVRDSAGSNVFVSGRFPSNSSVRLRRNLSFTRSFLGYEKLGERVSDVQLKNAAGNAVSFQVPVPGEFVADSEFAEWSYTIDLTPRKEKNAAAHISWLTKDAGLLMLGDVLPAFKQNGFASSAKVTIVLPDGWHQLENRVDGIVESKDVRSEVVTVGKNIRYRKTWVDKTSVTICIQGEWLFTGDEITNFAGQIYKQLRTVFNGDPTNDVLVNMYRFPGDLPSGQWQAETRGRNITIISSDMGFKTQSVQRLNEQLRHEMFHLWIPNGVNLSGNYDWFYEGFALYQSLKTGVALNAIRFDDLLDTLSRAQSIDARQTNRLSLIDASGKRWSGADTYIYARGMVTAFLFDIQLLNASKGKRSVETLIRDLYAKHRFPAERTDGNSAVLSIAAQYPELAPLIERYVKGDGKFEWQSELALAGLEAKPALSVIAKPSGRQKDMLDSLGYNNWKRSSPK